MANLSICLEECCDPKSFHSLPNVYLRQSFLEYPSPFIYKLTIKLTQPEDCLHHTEIQSNDCYIFDDRCSNVKQFIKELQGTDAGYVNHGVQHLKTLAKVITLKKIILN